MFKQNNISKRFLLLVIVSVLLGAYWKHSWPFALAIILVGIPVALAVLVEKYLSGLPAWSRYLTFCLLALVSEVVRNILYWENGGKEYLLHDSETQLVLGFIFLGQLLVGGLAIGCFRFVRKHLHSSGGYPSGEIPR